eukprot:6187259-Pleurochrysis_carterae.AAC.1
MIGEAVALRSKRGVQSSKLRSLIEVEGERSPAAATAPSAQSTSSCLTAISLRLRVGTARQAHLPIQRARSRSVKPAL